MEIVVRAAVMFAFVLIVIRALGSKELSELSAFQFVLLITIGDLIQQGVTQEDQSITGAMLAVSVFALLSVMLSAVSLRWRRGRRLLAGTPIMIVRDGRVLTDVLKVERLTLDQVQEAARQEGIADLAQVRVGVLEPDGQLSFLKYDDDASASSRGQDKRPKA
jgi:uncharacterized membrane protein YcaP (DUF421 family)